MPLLDANGYVRAVKAPVLICTYCEREVDTSAGKGQPFTFRSNGSKENQYAHINCWTKTRQDECKRILATGEPERGRVRHFCAGDGYDEPWLKDLEFAAMWKLDDQPAKKVPFRQPWFACKPQAS